MHILCTICSDLVNPAENIHVTKCGHIFHYHCLSQWIVRSKSCPQCRNKVTDKCIYRIYPTISNELTTTDATTLQSKLDDAALQLRQQQVTYKELEDKFVAMGALLSDKELILKTTEKKLDSRDATISLLKKQLEYVSIENKELHTIKKENENLKNKIQNLRGLEKVLNGTKTDMELMLESYTDIKSVAIFAVGLKQALCDTENKYNQCRSKLEITKRHLAQEESSNSHLRKLLQVTKEKYASYKRCMPKTMKENVTDSVDQSQLETAEQTTNKSNDELNHAMIQSESNMSIGTMVNKIENADSPYLSLKQSNLALTALQRFPKHKILDTNLKPSEFAMLNSAKNATKKPEANITSIFKKKEPIEIQFSQEEKPDSNLFNISYDGLGGHSKLDTFPKPIKPVKSLVPKLSAKHKLKRPNTGNHDISKMLKRD